MKKSQINRLVLLSIPLVLFPIQSMGSDNPTKAENEWVSVEAPGARRFGIKDFHVFPEVTNVEVRPQSGWTLIKPEDGIAELAKNLDASALWLVKDEKEDSEHGFIYHCRFWYSDDPPSHVTDPSISIADDPSPISIQIQGNWLEAHCTNPDITLTPAIHEILRVYTRDCPCGNTSPVPSEVIETKRNLNEFTCTVFKKVEFTNGLVSEHINKIPAISNLTVALNGTTLANERIPSGMTLEKITIILTLSGKVASGDDCPECVASAAITFVHPPEES